MINRLTWCRKISLHLLIKTTAYCLHEAPNPPSSFRQAAADLMLLCIRERGKLRTRTFICSTKLLTLFIPLPPLKLEAGSDSLYSASILHPLIFFFFFLNTYHPIPFLPPLLPPKTSLKLQFIRLNKLLPSTLNVRHYRFTSSSKKKNVTISQSIASSPRSLHGTWCCLCYSFVNSSV